jgi:hypothetical protein
MRQLALYLQGLQEFHASNGLKHEKRMQRGTMVFQIKLDEESINDKWLIARKLESGTDRHGK